MAYKYTINSVNIPKGTFVVQFEGVEPLNMYIPNDGTKYLTGTDLENAIQAMYPFDALHAQTVSSFPNGSEIESLVTVPVIPPATEEDIRLERNGRLTLSDWTQLPDVNLPNASEWGAYRQALRDLTSQAGFPTNVIWPTEPAK